MASVTEIVRTAKQPYGGFIKPSLFKEVRISDETELALTENLSPATVGMVVDYMTRYIMGAKLTDAFRISCMGAMYAKNLGYTDAVDVAKSFLRKIKGLDNESIVYACRMVWFDAYYRVPMWAKQHESREKNDPDAHTVTNIRTMINRSVSFWNKYGPPTKNGFTFEPMLDSSEEEMKEMTKNGSYGGYTYDVDRGDGDYLTEDTLWDYKVSKNKLTSKTTLQLRMYWIMGVHSDRPEFKTINKLGVFNPRLNTVYILDVSDIPEDTIRTVEKNVIGYEKPMPARMSTMKMLFEEPVQARKREFVTNRYEKGDIVEHKVFGRGRVLAVKAAAGDQIVEINFEKVGVKKTMANFAPLTKITEE